MRVAAFDLGTNTTLCAVVESDPSGVLVVVGDRAIVTGLGRGASPALAPERVAATLAAISDLAGWARALGATRFSAVGTSALRDAPNRDALLEPARAILGGPVEAITGLREARLTFAGALIGIPHAMRPVELTVIDVGGGSTEIIRGRAGEVMALRSLDVGAVRLTERWLRSDPPTRAEREALIADVDRALDALPDGLLAAPLLLLAGSATNLAGCALGLPVERLREAIGRRVAASALHAAVDRLLIASIYERRALPGVEPGREGTVAGGALLLGRLVERAGAADVLVGDGGVRFGLALELLDAR